MEKFKGYTKLSSGSLDNVNTRSMSSKEISFRKGGGVEMLANRSMNFSNDNASDSFRFKGNQAAAKIYSEQELSKKGRASIQADVKKLMAPHIKKKQENKQSHYRQMKKKLVKTGNKKIPKDTVNDPYFHTTKPKWKRVVERLNPWVGVGMGPAKSAVHQIFRNEKDEKEGVYRDPFAGKIRTRS